MSESIKSLQNTMTCDFRDWGLTSNDAWIYGIVVGWGSNSLDELQKRFNWTNFTVRELKRLHVEFVSGGLYREVPDET